MSQAGIINLSSQSGVVDSVTGSNGVTASPTTGNVVVSGVNATTSSVGVASFNSANFTVNGSGQVSISAVPVSEGGTGDSTLTANSVLIGNGTSAVKFAGPSATVGQVLQSAGLSSTPAYSTATYPLTTTVNRLLYSSATNTVSELVSTGNGTLVTSSTGIPSILGGPGTTGNILQSNAAAAPSFSTATYPSTAGTSGKILVSDGTNIVSSTPTFPNASATSGKFIRSDGTNWIASTPTLPTSAGTSGKVLQSDGTNYVESTATFPSTATGTGTILRANGTNWVATTATYPTTTTAFQLLASTAASVIGEITAGATGTVLTGVSGAVPAFSATPALTSITLSGGTALSTYVEGTFTPTVDGTVPGSTGYVYQVGTYTKIGRMVFYSIDVSVSSATGTGTLIIAGLPFTVITVANSIEQMSVRVTNLTWPAGGTMLTASPLGGTTTISITSSGSAIAGGFLQIANTAFVIKSTGFYFT